MHPPEEPMKRPDIRLYQEFGIIKTCRSGRTPTSMTRMRINVGADGRSQTGSGFPRRLCTSAHDWRVISSLFTLFLTRKGDRSMRDDISDIAASYDRGVEDEDSRLVLHQLEYDLTWRYLRRYLPPAGSILEIGAGTGRYTLALCRRGYSVTADDLSPALLQPCQVPGAGARPHGQARVFVGQAHETPPR